MKPSWKVDLVQTGCYKRGQQLHKVVSLIYFLGTYGWGLKFSMFDPYSASGKQKQKFNEKICVNYGYGD